MKNAKAIKSNLKKTLGERNYNRLTSLKFKLSSTFYLENQNIKIFFKKTSCFKNQKYLDGIENTIKEIEKNKNKKYIIFHNPSFLGVTSATKELFENLVPMTDLYRKKDVNKVYKAIINTDVKEVYFSAFCYNWCALVKKLKRNNPDLVIKTYWHGSHSQILDTFGWNRNQEILKLHMVGYIDQMATCKKSLLNFYLKCGYDAVFLNNTVTFDGNQYKKDIKNDKLKLGLYSANTEWRKNMMCQVAAAKTFKNAVIDMVPVNPEAALFASSLGVTLEGLPKPIPRTEILARMAMNDVNVYVTFSECAPMLPIESLEVGVPCISGNNHHFFKDTPLEKYLIINNETDIFEIKQKINSCIKNKEKILTLYAEWKKNNDLYTKEMINNFLNGGENNE